VIAKHSKEIPLERINDVAFSQGVFDRMIGAGSLMIESAGERGQEQITHVRHPERVQKTIYEESEKNQNRMMQPRGAAPAEQSVASQIEALSRLKEQGLISDGEYESKRQELLKRM
ncbi:MAG TPA: PH domain-containing protein, partial [Actinomycetota bacterium]|nr:PH domain-containing protein [Actinomycetota bacterium]